MKIFNQWNSKKHIDEMRKRISNQIIDQFHSSKDVKIDPSKVIIPESNSDDLGNKEWVKDFKKKWIDVEKNELSEEPQKLKYRIKESIHYMGNEIIHNYLPEFYIKSKPAEMFIDFLDYDSEDMDWVVLSYNLHTYEEALQVCKNKKPYINRWETKIHEIEL